MAKANKTKSRTIIYRPHMSIGCMAAEDDEKYLHDCFVRTGDFEILTDMDSPKSILLGRTGSGKSASIYSIHENEDNVIEIDPQSLALNYISNSDVLRFYNDIGVDLDIFYNLLWRHIFSVELLQYYFKVRSETDANRLKDWLASVIGTNKNREFAVKYLERWSSSFWAETEERIKEITKKLENELAAEVGLDAYGLSLGSRIRDGISTEVKSEIVSKAQKVVNQIQIRDLGEVIRLLGEELFHDTSKKYYIVIDRLDEKWVEDELRHKLIRALIEAIKSFRKIRSVKIIVALRSDLLERVYKETRDSGFQEEKYEDLNVRIKWNRNNLMELVDSRINLMFKDQYTTENIGFYDLFPHKVREKDSFDYLLSRTLMRPRDVIAYINNVFVAAEGKTQITTKMIMDAETVYSEQRKHAILQEWYTDYPKLEMYCKLLENKPTSFSFSDIEQSDLDYTICALLEDVESNDAIEKKAKDALEINAMFQYEDFKREIVKILYKIGFVGIKTQPSTPWIYSYTSNPTISSYQLKQDTKIQIHPMLWRAFRSYKMKKGVLATS